MHCGYKFMEAKAGDEGALAISAHKKLSPAGSLDPAHAAGARPRNWPIPKDL